MCEVHVRREEGDRHNLRVNQVDCQQPLTESGLLPLYYVIAHRIKLETCELGCGLRLGMRKPANVDFDNMHQSYVNEGSQILLETGMTTLASFLKPSRE